MVSGLIMRTESKSEYHLRRAREEADLAERSKDAQARSLHLSLSVMHRERADPAAAFPDLMYAASA